MFVFLIIVGGLLLFLALGAFLYCKLRKNSNYDRTVVKQDEANEGENNHDENGDELGQQNDLPNEGIEANHMMVNIETNQV